jgi:transglutaminase-like putative cysteine protease
MQPYLAASTTIDSESKALEKVAREWIGENPEAPEDASEQTSTAEKAAALASAFAAEFEELTEIQPEVRTTYQLTTSKKADMLEAARLYAAMLRTLKIPSRCAAGAVLDTDSSTLRLSVWTEAWVGDKWVGWNPTTGEQIDARHIKFADSPMDTANPYELLFSVADQFANYEFTISSQAESAN